MAKPRKSTGDWAPIIIVGRTCWIRIGNEYHWKSQIKSHDSSNATDTLSPNSQYKKVKPNGQNSWMIKLRTISGLNVASDWNEPNGIMQEENGTLQPTNDWIILN